MCNNQRGSSLFFLIVSLAFGFFITASIFFLFSKTLLNNIEQDRFNNYIADRDSLILEVEKALAASDSVTIKNYDVEDLDGTIYKGELKATQLVISKSYKTTKKDLQEVFTLRDDDRKVVLEKVVYDITNTGNKVSVDKSETKVFKSLNKLNVNKITKFCFDNSSNTLDCKNVSNLLEIIFYSNGDQGISKEFHSRRLMYYDEK